MKTLKYLLVVILAVCSFASANAQIRVRIGGHPHRHYYHRHWHRWHHRPYHHRW